MTNLTETPDVSRIEALVTQGMHRIGDHEGPFSLHVLGLGKTGANVIESMVTAHRSGGVAADTETPFHALAIYIGGDELTPIQEAAAATTSDRVPGTDCQPARPGAAWWGSRRGRHQRERPRLPVERRSSPRGGISRRLVIPVSMSSPSRSRGGTDADRLRAGIIGTGFIGTVHAHAVRASGATVATVAASTPRSAIEAAERLGAAAAETAEALIDADDVDVVHICTPNATHAPLADGALAAGKHVICEKPLATTLDDARMLTALARRARRGGNVPFVYRYYPTVREARARIAAGDAGAAAPAPRLVPAGLAGAAGADATGGSTRPLGGASRAFADIGVHWCDLMEFVTGHRITRLAARTVLPRSRRGGRPGAAPRTRGRAVRDRPRRDPAAWWSARSRRAARTGCGSPSTARRVLRLRPGAPEHPLDRRPRGSNLILPRGAGGLARRAPRYSRAPGRPSAGLPGLLQRLRRRRLRRGPR